MKSKIVKVFLCTVAFCYMFVNKVYAANDIVALEDEILKLLSSIVPVIIGIAVIFFLWAGVRFMKAGDNLEERQNARDLMIYGIVGILVMVSLWGIIQFFGNVLGITPGSDKNLDTFKEMIISE